MILINALNNSDVNSTYFVLKINELYKHPVTYHPHQAPYTISVIDNFIAPTHIAQKCDHCFIVYQVQQHTTAKLKHKHA